MTPPPAEAALKTSWSHKSHGSADPRSFSRGLSLFGVHGALYSLTLLGALMPLPLWMNIISAVASGVFIALLFIIGHDAAHGSLLPSPRLNSLVARLAFLPCLHSVSLWREIHNKRHHGFTNLKGVDNVWAPMSKAEYDTATPARRWLERVYRGPFGPLIYYYGTYWPHRMVLPIARDMRGNLAAYLPDGLLVAAAFLLTIGGISWAGGALAPDRPVWLVLLLGWALPFAVWNYLMGFTIYLNHTHPAIPWYDDEAKWRRHADVLRDTTHVKMPVNAIPLYTRVNAHTAHHMRPLTPVYSLEAEQRRLHNIHDGLVSYTLMPRSYLAICRACKLFDFERMCWTDFDGTPTAWPMKRR